MYHKINADELRAGMYAVDTGVSWLSHPYLYAVEGELAEAEITALREEGYTETYIDLTRCRPGSLPPELENLVAPHAAEFGGTKDFLPPPPKMSLREELPKARAVFRSSLTMARNLMEDIRKGAPVDLPSAEPLVEDILDSLDRNASALFSLCKLRQKDDYTYTHCVNVSVLTVIFARGLGLGEDALRGIGLGGLFHDVGKALVPQRILQAPRKLNDEEMAVMKRHPVMGAEYLKEYRNAPKEVFQMTLEHHEQYSGGGYPRGLRGESISLPGRIAAVVDVFDALSSKRVYKSPLPLSKCLGILYSMRSKEFFPDMAERFIRLLGVYPVGSAVELEDDSLGVVFEPNMNMPMRPTVALVRTKKGQDLGGRLCDLTEPASPAIRRSISARELGTDPASILGLPL